MLRGIQIKVNIRRLSLVMSLTLTCVSEYVWAGGAEVVSVDSLQTAGVMSADDYEFMRRDIHANADRLKMVGYLELTDEASSRFSLDELLTHFVPEETVLAKLTFPYREFGTDMVGARKRGILVPSIASLDDLSTSDIDELLVVYELPEKEVLLIVKQKDESQVLSRTFVFSEFVNAQLGQIPGTLVSRKARDGKVVSTLTWYTDRFRFEVFAAGYLKVSELEHWAMEMGMSVAKSM